MRPSPVPPLRAKRKCGGEPFLPSPPIDGKGAATTAANSGSGNDPGDPAAAMFFWWLGSPRVLPARATNRGPMQTREEPGHQLYSLHFILNDFHLFTYLNTH